ncbi:MAG: hypothetical protein MJA30_36735 [Cytophagales bacterium]|nr:hypothetical protein [Cytophagales bacterium]
MLYASKLVFSYEEELYIVVFLLGVFAAVVVTISWLLLNSWTMHEPF